MNDVLVFDEIDRRPKILYYIEQQAYITEAWYGITSDDGFTDYTYGGRYYGLQSKELVVSGFRFICEYVTPINSNYNPFNTSPIFHCSRVLYSHNSIHNEDDISDRYKSIYLLWQDNTINSGIPLPGVKQDNSLLNEAISAINSIQPFTMQQLGDDSHSLIWAMNHILQHLEHLQEHAISSNCSDYSTMSTCASVQPLSIELQEAQEVYSAASLNKLDNAPVCSSKRLTEAQIKNIPQQAAVSSVMNNYNNETQTFDCKNKQPRTGANKTKASYQLPQFNLSKKIADVRNLCDKSRKRTTTHLEQIKNNLRNSIYQQATAKFNSAHSYLKNFDMQKNAYLTRDLICVNLATSLLAQWCDLFDPHSMRDANDLFTPGVFLSIILMSISSALVFNQTIEINKQTKTKSKKFSKNKHS